MTALLSFVIYLILAPFIGGLLDGLDRKISARMQGRIGPPLLQPFYDVAKLMHKQNIAVNRSQEFLVASFCMTQILAGCMFFAGSDILFCFFIISTGSTFLVFAGAITNSPYSSLGSSRELIQMMAYEPAVLLACVGLYLASGSFNVRDIVMQDTSAILFLPGFFLSYIFILTIKMRKSPFDLSTSHHPHQELVKGLTTEMGGRNLAYYTITEWYENVFLLGVVALFIINKNPSSYIAAIIVVLAVCFVETLIDNVSARVKWNFMLKSTWISTLLLAGVNLLILMLV
ncbi:MAG: NADH-quinone oxidoreductase subunit H [Eubacteriales bacterium]|nr:NADH-quinone oxidoreductase subunit H [Eubacteriales bacterium]